MSEAESPGPTPGAYSQGTAAPGPTGGGPSGCDGGSRDAAVSGSQPTKRYPAATRRRRRPGKGFLISLTDPLPPVLLAPPLVLVSYLTAGSPAHAGIDLVIHAPHQFTTGFPRTRGDRPIGAFTPDLGVRFPRIRGDRPNADLQVLSWNSSPRPEGSGSKRNPGGGPLRASSAGELVDQLPPGRLRGG